MQHVSDKHYRRPGMGSLIRYATLFTGWRRLCLLTALLCGVAVVVANENSNDAFRNLGDFNGDGKDDVLLRHEDGRWFYYPMDGRRHITSQRGLADLTRKLDWHVAGIGDLNGDGKDDVLLRHEDGRWFYYPMNGRRHITSQRGLADLTRKLDWHVAGIGDLNGDGKDDVLLRHEDGRWFYYPMDGRRHITGERGLAGLTRKLDWHVAGIGDLNGDGKDDVLLRHTDGRWFYYPMNGRRHITGERGLAGLTRKLDWHVAGIGDLNGDGKDDVLLRHTDGRWYYYPMDGRNPVADQRGLAGLTRKLDWQVAGIGDLNGDGRDDVLLRHTDSRWYYYPMDGRRHITGERGLANLTRNPDWSIAALPTGFAPADQSGDMTDDGDGDIYVPFPSGEGEFSIDDTGGLTWRLGGFTQRIGNAGCIRGDFTFNGVFHDLGTSKWQMRTGPTAAWSDVQGTIETDAICGYDLTAAAPGHQYRTVVEITIGGERKMYSSNIITKNTDQGNPDLVVESPSVSDSAPITGQSFTFGVTVRNQGGGQAVTTTLRYYRSTDATISTGDTEVGTDAVSALTPAGTSDESISLTAPSTAGTYYYGACVDAVSGESDTGNNCSSAVRVTVSDSQTEIQGFDLVAGNDDPDGITFANDRLYVVDGRDSKVYAYQATGQRDADSDFDLDLSNSSATGITFANDKFYLIDWLDDKVYAYQASGQRDADSDFDLDSDNGNPHGIAFADESFYVTDESDDKVYVYQATGQRDADSDFDLDTDNGSPLGITFANDRFYVVDSGELDWVYVYQASGQRDADSDFHLDSAAFSPSGITFANNRFYVVHDRILNSESRDRVYVVNPTQAPDLVVGDASVSETPAGTFYLSGITVETGDSFVLKNDVRNRGTLASGATTLRYYRSSDSTISTGDTEVGTDAVSALSASDTSAQMISLSAPSTAGTYYYGACVDPVSGESDTGNNCSSAVSVTVRARAPDLTVESPSVSDTTPESGGSFVFTATVRNRGTSMSNATTLRYYRSENRTISTSDMEVGTDTVSALSVDETSSKMISLPAPSTAGTYYYGACVDPVTGESDTGNNCSSAVTVFGGGPFPLFDLDISRIILHSPSLVLIGQDAIRMTVDVTNRGPNASRPAKLRFSGDDSFDLDIPVLDPNETVTFERQKVGTARLGTTTYRACITEAPGEENTANNCESRSVTYR